ncbi:hypothetical protein Agub_g3484 [Astrephomene gubernaculifera]|uniref:Uncharacterized protein n=1 Tax=Astrephomene gubernaculifera TaxID=47775 RepID=A0AAD3DJH6_9CHLO|nr:hypothetical protein Agub_g3484 [Astrephomene gubernaculifera]
MTCNLTGVGTPAWRPPLVPCPFRCRTKPHILTGHAPRQRIATGLLRLPATSERMDRLGTLTPGDASHPAMAAPDAAALDDWSEAAAWEAAMQSAPLPPSASPLPAALAGLAALLPDLAPRWRALLAARQELLRIEAALGGTSAAAAAGGGGGGEGGADSASSSSSSPLLTPDAALQLLNRLEGLAGELRPLVPHATTACLHHCIMVLGPLAIRARWGRTGPHQQQQQQSQPQQPPHEEPQLQAPQSPQTQLPLLPQGDVAVAAGAVRVARHSLEAHLEALMELQVRLACRLQAVAVRLVWLREEMPGTDVGKLVAARLDLLLPGEQEEEEDRNKEN